MAKLAKPLFGDWATGKVSPCLDFVWRQEQGYIRKNRIGQDRVSLSQQVQRAKFQDCAKAWGALSDEERDYWNAQAHDDFSGYDLFMQDCLS